MQSRDEKGCSLRTTPRPWGIGTLWLLALLGGLLAFASESAWNAAPVPRGEVPRVGLLWRLDEGEGFSVAEARGRTPPGQICGARWVPGPGGRGAALRFDGIDDFVVFPSSPALSPRRALTLALWVYLERLPDIPWRNDFRFVLGKSSLRAYSLVLERDGTLNASVYVGGRRQSLRTREPLPLREWVHVAFTYDGASGRGRLYLDGALAAEGQGARGDLDANDKPLVLGSALFHNLGDVGGGIRSFPGALDELRVLPWALSPPEVERLAGRRALDPARSSRNPPPPPPSRLLVRATLDGQPVLAQVIVRPEGASEDCPEAFYTHRPLDPEPVGTSPRPRPRLYGDGGPGLGTSTDTGTGDVLLPPGEALVSVDVGGGFTGLPVARRVRLEPGGTTVLSVDLKRQFDPRERGYFAADLHVHTRASADGVTPVETLVWAQAAADLDLAVLSDHNTAVGHLPFLEVAERRGMPYLLSEEVTTSAWGHFNPFSLDPGQGITVSREKVPREYFQEARAKGATLIQVNHSLWGGGQGYFTRMDEPEFDWGFQLVEVINGFDGRVSDTDRKAIEALFALWSQGRRVVATAGSDDHNADKPTARVGTPRTYAYVGLPEGEPLTAERWLEALARGRAFVTTGPLVYLTVTAAAGVEGEAGGKPRTRPGPGARLPLGPGETLTLRAEVESVRELRSLSLWHNGRVVRTYPLEGRRASVEWSGRARFGWYAVTVESEGGGFALTNPVWVEPVSPQEPPRKGGAPD